MKINPDGTATINLFDTVEQLDAKTLLSLADSIGCVPDVIAAVADQIITGWTEMSSHAPRTYGETEPSTPLEKAIRRVAIGAGEVAAKEIAALTERCAALEAKINRVEELKNERYDFNHHRDLDPKLSAALS